MENKPRDKEIYIRLRDGEKESELRLDKISEKHKLPLINGFFKFFDVDINLQEMADTYVRVGSSYKSFYDKAEGIEFTESNEPIKTGVKPKPEQPKAAEVNVTAMSDADNYLQTDNDYYKTGVKEKNGLNHYRCHYSCPNCGNRGNHYIRHDNRMVVCHECRQQMVVKSASTKGFPHTDIHTNFFVAGNYVPKEQED